MKQTTLYLATLIIFPALAYAQTETEKNIRSAMQKYETGLSQARKQMSSVFDGYANAVKKSGGNLEQLGQKLASIENDKKAFIESGIIPKDEMYNDALFLYAQMLHQAQLPVIRAYESAYQKAIKKNDAATLLFLANQKAKIDQALTAREQFKPNTIWTGFRMQLTRVPVNPKKPQMGFKPVQNQFSIKLNVENIQGNTFSGKLEQGLGFKDHPEFKAAGQTEGTMIKWWIETPINAAMRRHDYTGYVVGDRIFGKVIGWTPDGNRLEAVFRLTRK